LRVGLFLGGVLLLGVTLGGGALLVLAGAVLSLAELAGAVLARSLRWRGAGTGELAHPAIPHLSALPGRDRRPVDGMRNRETAHAADRQSYDERRGARPDQDAAAKPLACARRLRGRLRRRRGDGCVVLLDSLGCRRLLLCHVHEDAVAPYAGHRPFL
jgi:hypothetical protein